MDIRLTQVNCLSEESGDGSLQPRYGEWRIRARSWASLPLPGCLSTCPILHQMTSLSHILICSTTRSWLPGCWCSLPACTPPTQHRGSCPLSSLTTKTGRWADSPLPGGRTWWVGTWNLDTCLLNQLRLKLPRVLKPYQLMEGSAAEEISVSESTIQISVMV